MSLVPGMRLGPYAITDQIGVGGMGEVWRALDTGLGRRVAIKVLPDAVAHDPERLARFEREARTLASLSHPNIAGVYGLEHADGARAVVMELVEGTTLADRIARGPIPPEEALALARQIAEALEAAHDQGIVHRDLKPANIMVRTDGVVKVLDFGLAKTFDAIPSAGMDATPAPTPTITNPAISRMGVVLGTAAYMSPEQARGQPADKRSDVWAFGCVLYEMLTGRRAFAAEGISDTIAAVLRADPDWAALPPAPDAVNRLLRRCLRKDPRHRLRDMGDARLEIEDAMAAPDAGPIGSGRDRTRRDRVAALTLVIVLTALAITAAILYGRPRPGVPELRVELTTPRAAEPWWFVVSPDGRTLAFVAERDGQSMLWVRPLDAARAQPLAGTEGARHPFWSPDGRSLGFFGNEGLKRIEARGGPTQAIAAASGPTGGAWGADGTILFSDSALASLRRVSTSGGPIEVATTSPAGATGHRHPQFLPGGRDFLFFAGGPDDLRGVYLASLDSSNATRLVASDAKGVYVSPGWLLFVRQGVLLAQRFDVARRALSGEPITIAESVAFDPLLGSAAFSASEGGVIAYRSGHATATQLLWFDRSGDVQGRLGSGDETGLANPRLSPDGRRLAVERTIGSDTNLWLLDASRQMVFTRQSGGGFSRYPVWSPDGSRIAYQSGGAGSMSILVKSLAGGDEEVLLESSRRTIPTDWSRDGRFLLFYEADPKTNTDLWVLPLKEKGGRFLFLKTGAAELHAQFSPDGRWVAYQSNETGRFEIYVRPFPGPGGETLVSTAGGIYPRWSPDGRELYYIAPDARLMAAPISTNGNTLDAGTPAALFQTRRAGGGANIVGRTHQYDVDRTGRFVINVEAASSTPPISLLLNWRP